YIRSYSRRIQYKTKLVNINTSQSMARKTYDKSIGYLSSAIESAEIEREQRIGALRRLAEYSARMFNED
ncbi:MAG TPA: hypothetical protein VE593_11985, partial [Nitrososphaeraceae archaeon]|nr:hypothetical protein [Nitrososphaeraceae archaeon]